MKKLLLIISVLAGVLTSACKNDEEELLVGGWERAAYAKNGVGYCFEGTWKEVDGKTIDVGELSDNFELTFKAYNGLHKVELETKASACEAVLLDSVSELVVSGFPDMPLPVSDEAEEFVYQRVRFSMSGLDNMVVKVYRDPEVAASATFTLAR